MSDLTIPAETTQPIPIIANDIAGFATGGPRLLLRLEGALVLLGAAYAYHRLDSAWSLFAALFFVPDLSMLGYLFGPHVGARIYNAGHSYLAPALLLAVGLLTDIRIALLAGIIWAAHIGFDRALGYGLKYKAGFGYTHLGRLTMGVARR